MLLYARQDVQRTLNRSLDSLAEVVEDKVVSWQTVPDRAQFEVDLSDAIPPGFDDLYGVIAEVVSPEGDLQSVQGGPLGGELRRAVAVDPWSAASVSKLLLRPRTSTDTLLIQDTRSIRLDDGGEARIIVSLNAFDAASAVGLMAKVMLLSLPVSALSLGIAAWVVAGIAVRPLHEVEEFAAQLGPSSVGRPVELSAGGSEVDSVRVELSEAMDRIEQAYQEQARFLANVAHEIKTPISVVLTEAEVLLMRPREPDEVARFVRSTAEEMQRLGSMVESFLLLTRVEAGEGRVRRKNLGLNDLLMDAVEQSHRMAMLHEVFLSAQLCDDEEPPQVRGNAELLQTAIGNLIRNAIRFTPHGKAVEVSCGIDEGMGMIRVRDYGPGIPDELLPRLFEPFTQASEERRRRRGSGLGLQIAKGIAELHEGDIRAENLKVGCRFTFRLPLTR